MRPLDEPRKVETDSRRIARDSIRGNQDMSKTIYEAVGGFPKILDLARAWHARCMADPVVSHAFSHGYHPQHTERLARYWAQALGGPSDYTGSIADESYVVRLHSGNGEHREMDERAQTCFARAIDDASIPKDETLRSTLKAYFHWAVQRMSAYPESPDDVPPGLAFPRWSWAGPDQ
jgi:hemoglobin